MSECFLEMADEELLDTYASLYGALHYSECYDGDETADEIRLSQLRSEILYRMSRA